MQVSSFIPTRVSISEEASMAKISAQFCISVSLFSSNMRSPNILIVSACG